MKKNFENSNIKIEGGVESKKFFALTQADFDSLPDGTRLDYHPSYVARHKEIEGSKFIKGQDEVTNHADKTGTFTPYGFYEEDIPTDLKIDRRNMTLKTVDEYKEENNCDYYTPEEREEIEAYEQMEEGEEISFNEFMRSLEHHIESLYKNNEHPSFESAMSNFLTAILNKLHGKGGISVDIKKNDEIFIHQHNQAGDYEKTISLNPMDYKEQK
ncbi:MAG: hypothetical protein ABIJ83_01735 [Patescibacteria group bacterium]